MRRAVLAFVSFLVSALAVPAGAGGTGVSMTIVTVPLQCTLQNACTNLNPDACASDADCLVGTLEPRSKLSFGGKKGVVKASLRGVTDAAGMPVTTDGTVGTGDDYILLVHFTDCDYSNILGCNDQARLQQGIPLKVELRKGNANLKVDLSEILEGSFLAGAALKVRGADLRLPPANPGSCPGDNTTAGIFSRSYESCQNGPHLGFTGILVGQ